MDFSAIEAVCEKYGCTFERNSTLADKTSMRIGGECGEFVEVGGEECLSEVLSVCRRENIPYFIIGRGSNLLARRFGGVVIRLGGSFKKVSVEGNRIIAGAGTALSQVCLSALENSLTGVECLYGIPGSVGGALYMNAGAYGGEIKDTVRRARCLDENGEIVVLSVGEMELSYRSSVFSARRMCILSAELELTNGDKTEIRARMDELMKRRSEKQPLEYPSCGSTFKRPKDGFAAAMIEECGLKGYAVGGAQVSEKHSGFVINKGGATFEDVMSVVEHVKRVVKERKGVELECEMLILDE